MEENIVKLLKKTEGQIKAINKMIENGRDTIDIIIQISAVRGALARVAIELIKYETVKCMNCGDLKTRAEKFNLMVEELLKRI